MAEISPLRRRMIGDMMIRNLSPATQQPYLYAVAKFTAISDAPQTGSGWKEVRAYQIHLIPQQRSWSHINQVVCALRFVRNRQQLALAVGEHWARARPWHFGQCRLRHDYRQCGSHRNPRSARRGRRAPLCGTSRSPPLTRRCPEVVQ